MYSARSLTRCDIITCVSRAENLGHVLLAKPGGGLDQRVQHGSEIEGRAAYDLEHVSGGRLLLQRLVEFRVRCCSASNSRTFSSRSPLGRRGHNEIDFLLGEWVNRSPAQEQHADGTLPRAGVERRVR